VLCGYQQTKVLCFPRQVSTDTIPVDDLRAWEICARCLYVHFHSQQRYVNNGSCRGYNKRYRFARRIARATEEPRLK